MEGLHLSELWSFTDKINEEMKKMSTVSKFKYDNTEVLEDTISVIL